MSAALPSILDLGRHHQSISDMHDRIDAAWLADDPLAAKVIDAADRIWLERGIAIAGLILTMPAVTLADAAVQLQAALSELDRQYIDDWPRAAQSLAHRLRRVLVSTALVITREAGIDPGIMGFPHLEKIHRSEFPAGLPDELATPAATRSREDTASQPVWSGERPHDPRITPSQ